MSTNQLPSIELELTVPDGPLLVGERHPFVVEVRRPSSFGSPIQLANVQSRSPTLLLDQDLFQRDLILNPGESYRILVPVEFTQPGRYDRNAIWIQFRNAETGVPDHQLCPEGPLIVQPSPKNEIHVELMPICDYEDGTKVQLSLEHRGATTFEEFELRLEPSEAVLASKTMRRVKLEPGDKEELEMVLRPGTLELVFRTKGFGEPLETRKWLVIPQMHTLAPKPKFEFLEPRQLSSDYVSVSRGKGANKKPVPLQHGAYPVCGQEQYEIVIRPHVHNVKEVQFHEAADKIHSVGDPRYDPNTNSYTVLVEIVTDRLLSRRERVFYDVVTPMGELRGELHFFIQPGWKRLGLFAATAGAALTVQGAIGLFRLLRDGGISPERLITETVINWEVGWNLLSLLSVPLIWIGMPGIDWMVDRLTFDE